MTGRLRKSIAMALVAALCFTQNAGIVRAAEPTENIGGLEDISNVSENDSTVSSVEAKEETDQQTDEVIAEEAPKAEEGVTEEAAGERTPKDTVTITNLSINPGKYTADVSASYTCFEPINPIRRLVLLYTEGDKDVVSNNDVVSRNSLNKGGVNSGWYRLGCGDVVEGSGSTQRTLAGPPVGGSDYMNRGLKPNTTYSCYLTLEQTDVQGDIYLITDRYTFTTSSGTITTTSVSKKSVNIAQDEHINVKLNNTNNEYISGFYFAEEGKATASEEELDENWAYIPEFSIEDEENWEYWVCFPEGRGVWFRNHLYAVVYTGDSPTLTLVDMGQVAEGVSWLDDEHISVSYEPGTSSIKAGIDIKCGETKPYFLDSLAVKISMNQADKSGCRYFYNDDEELDKAVVWKKNDTGYETTIPLTGFYVPEDDPIDIIPETAYDLWMSLGFYDVVEGNFDPVYTSDKNQVTTLSDTKVNTSEFDEGFLELICSEYEFEPVADTISQSCLDRVTWLETGVSKTPLSSIKGVKYLRNLEHLMINNNRISDIQEITQCSSINYLELIENSLEELPNLSVLTRLTTLDLDWNHIPESEIMVSKLPVSLEYTWYEGDEPVSVTREMIAEDMKERQHNQNDFAVETTYVDDGSGNYPFHLTVKNHKLNSLKKNPVIISGNLLETSFYVLEVAAKGTSDNSSGTKAGIIGRKLDCPEYIIQRFMEEYDLDECFYEKNKEIPYSFNVSSIAGIDSPGIHIVDWKLYKRNVWQEKAGLTVSADLLIAEDTLEVIHTSGMVVSVAVTPKKLNLNVGNSSGLTADVKVFPESYDSSVIWSSSDEKVATVDQQGNVTAKGVGTANITATSRKDSKKKDTCSVTVKYVLPTGLELTTTDGKNTTFVGQSLTLKPVFTPADSSYDASLVKYTSSASDVVSLSGNTVTGLKEGSSVITASYTVSGENTALSAKLNITVRRQSEAKKTFYIVTFVSDNKTTVLHTEQVLEGQPATEPGIKPEKADHMFIGWGVGETAWDFTTPINANLTLNPIFKKIKVEVTESSGSGMDTNPAADIKTEGEKVTGTIYLVKGQIFTTAENAGKNWQTANSSVAKVAKGTGKITAAGAGQTKVSNETHEYTVNVVEPTIAVSKVAGKESNVKPDKVELIVGETAEYEIKGITADNEKYPITWFSSNTRVARVNGGVVTGMAKGSANISAFIGGKEYKGKVTVKDVIKAPAKISGTTADVTINAMKAVQLKFDSFKAKDSTWEAAGDSVKLEVSKTDKKSKPTAWKNDKIEITNGGKITGIGEGTTSIKGTDKNGATVTINVTVKVISTKTTTFINKGKSETIKFPGINNKNGEWASTKPETATVDNGTKKGKVTGVVPSAESAGITCSVNGANDVVFETRVYCEDPKLKKDAGGKLSIDSKGVGTLNLAAGEVYKIETEDLCQTPAFKSSKKAAVFVDENGIIYARQKVKSANITAKVNGKTLKIKVSVK